MKKISANSLMMVLCLVICSPIAWGKDSDTNAPKQIDYNKRVMYLHGLVHSRIKQSRIDSMNKITHLILDSIRYEIASQKSKDNISLLEAVWHNGMKDSLLLVQVNTVLNSVTGNETGSISAYCINRSTQSPIDSVKITIYSHDSLITNSYSSHGGFCNIIGLRQGAYRMTFSKNKYTLFVDNSVHVTAGNITSLEIPLVEKPGLFSVPFSIYSWMVIGATIIFLFVSIYGIIRKFL